MCNVVSAPTESIMTDTVIWC